MYTFDDQLTTDQKLAHLQEWIAATSKAISDSAADGAHPDPRKHSDQSERQRMLIDWHNLVQAERELATSKADVDDPDPEGDEFQQVWCRTTRLKLKVAGVQTLLRAEKRKARPDEDRIARLEQRSIDLCSKLFIAKERTEGVLMSQMARIFGDCPCEGEGCTEDEPCAPCASRLALLQD